MGQTLQSCSSVRSPVTPQSLYDEAAVRSMLRDLMQKPEYDDGNLAPVFIRLAWHSAGTYDHRSGKYGSNGATMRFDPERSDPENAGLDKAMEFLEPVKQKFPEISFSDLWILASYVGLEMTGGPVIPFRPGRQDASGESVEAIPPNGNLPEAERPPVETPDTKDSHPDPKDLDAMAKKEKPTIDAMKTVFQRLGMSTREMTALICGGHVYGRCHRERSGYAGPWVEKMTEFSNEYAADMIEDEWAEVTSESLECPADLRPAPGKRQYVNGNGKGTQMMLVSDMALLWDAETRPILQEYAEDEELLKREFGAAFKRLTELGMN